MGDVGCGSLVSFRHPVLPEPASRSRHLASLLTARHLNHSPERRHNDETAKHVERAAADAAEASKALRPAPGATHLSLGRVDVVSKKIMANTKLLVTRTLLGAKGIATRGSWHY